MTRHSPHGVKTRKQQPSRRDAAITARNAQETQPSRRGQQESRSHHGAKDNAAFTVRRTLEGYGNPKTRSHHGADNKKHAAITARKANAAFTARRSQTKQGSE